MIDFTPTSSLKLSTVHLVTMPPKSKPDDTAKEKPLVTLTPSEQRLLATVVGLQGDNIPDVSPSLMVIKYAKIINAW